MLVLLVLLERNKKFSEKVAKYSRCLTDFPGGVIHPSVFLLCSLLLFLSPFVRLPQMIRIRLELRSRARDESELLTNDERPSAIRLLSRAKRRKHSPGESSIFLASRAKSICLRFESVICNSINSLGSRDKELSGSFIADDVRTFDGVPVGGKYKRITIEYRVSSLRR